MSLIITQGYGGESEQLFPSNIQWYVTRKPQEFQINVKTIDFYSRIIKTTNVEFYIKPIVIEFVCKVIVDNYYYKQISSV